MALTNQATITLAVNVQNMAGLSSLTKGLQSLQSRLMALQRNPAIRSATGLTSPAQQARSQAALIRAQGQINASQQRSALATQRYQMALGRLSAMQQKAAAAAARHKSNLGSLTQKISDAEHNVDALWRASFRLQMLGADFQRWGQALIGFVQGVTDQFGEFEFMANRAAGTLRLFNTDADSAAVSTYDLQDAIMAAAKEMRLFPAEDVAKAVYFWGSTTGQVVESQEDLENVMSSLTPVMKAAALTQTDYETAIKGVYGIMTQFNPEVIEAANATGEYAEMAALAEEVTTRLFFATQVTALEYTDLVQAFKMVGPVAAGVGATLEDMVGLMGRLADLGLRGSMAGRSFRQMFMRMAAPPGPARKAINALFSSLDVSVFGGKSYLEVMFPKGEFAGTAAFFTNMTKAVKGLNTVERINFLTKFSTANLLPTLIALIGQEERAQAGLGGEVDKTNVSLDEQRRVFDKSWKLLEGSWKGTVEGFNRSMENLTLVIGRAFAEGLKPFVDMAGNAVDRIQEWVRANEPLVEQLGQWIAAIGGVLIAIGTLFITMGSAIGVVAGLRLAFEAFGGVILRWTGYAIIIGGFIDAIIRNFDEVQARLQEAQASIQRALANVAGYFSDGEDAVGDFAETFRDLMDAVVEHSTNAIVVVAHIIEEVSKFKPLFDLIKNFGIPIVSNFLGLLIGAKILSVIAHLKILGLSLAGAGMGLVAFGKNLRATDVVIGPTLTRMQRLTLSFKNFAKANPQLILMAVAGFAFAAYENNWMNFKDIVDSLTDSFRNLKQEISGIEGDQRNKDWAKDFFNAEEARGAISAYEDAANAAIATRNAAGIPIVSDMLRGVALEQVTEEFKRLGQFYTAATMGAGTSEKALANLGTALEAAGYDFDEWITGFRFAIDELNLDPTWAQTFATALSETMADGVGSVAELEAELMDMGLNGSYYVNMLTDAQLKQLGITTRSAEEAAKLTSAYEGVAQGLISTLNAYPTTGLSTDQYISVSSIIAELNKVALLVGPEFRDTIDKAIAPYMGAAGEDLAAALGAGFEGADPEALVSDYLAGMGATHVPADTFSNLVDSLTLAIGEAIALTPGADIDFDALLKKVFADLDISVVTDFLYPQISAMGDGVAAAIGAVFRPGKFKEKLKGITKDEKGWKSFWKAVTDPIFQSSLRGERGSEAEAIAVEWAQDLFENFDTAFPAAAGPARDKLVTQLKGLFSKENMPTLDEDIQRLGTNLLTSMYAALGQPMPEWLKQYFIDFGGQIPGYIKDGAEGEQVVITLPEPVIKISDDDRRAGSASSNPYMRFLNSTKVALLQEPAMPVPPVGAPDTSAPRAAIDTLAADSSATLIALASNATTWGSHLVGNFATGMLNAKWRVKNAASDVAALIPDKLKFSKGPTEGPLKGFNEWGKHMMQNYAVSIEKGTPFASKAAAKAADAVARELKKGKGATEGITGKNGKALDDAKKTQKKLITSVKGARLYHTYDGYLDYLDRVHNKINDFRTTTKRVREDTMEDLNIGRHRTEGKTKFETSNKKKVEVSIKVESPDGSVNKAQLTAVRKGAMDAFVLSDVEHMVTVS